MLPIEELFFELSSEGVSSELDGAEDEGREEAVASSFAPQAVIDRIRLTARKIEIIFLRI